MILTALQQRNDWKLHQTTDHELPVDLPIQKLYINYLIKLNSFLSIRKKIIFEINSKTLDINE